EKDTELECTFTQGLLVLEATEQEISDAVADVAQTYTGTGGIFATDLVDLASFDVASVTGTVDMATVVNGAAGAGAGAGADAGAEAGQATQATGAATQATQAEETAAASATATANPQAGAGCKAKPQTTAAATATATNGAGARAETGANNAGNAAATSAAAGAGGSTGTNIQAFTGTLGGAPPPVVSSAGDRPFSVNGNTFTGAGAALSRSCDIQHNACANAANSGQLEGGVGQCETQLSECKAANA
ncbi:cell wall manno, partial [Fusarium albosuccineum]